MNVLRRYHITPGQLVAAIFGVLLFTLTRPALADLANYPQELQVFLESNTPQVGSETINGHQHVYYIFQDSKHVITSGDSNNYHPVAEGRYVVFQQTEKGADQIIKYDLITGAELQLTHEGTNQNPVIQDGKVAWERWDKDRWQVWLFNGTGSRKLTTGDVAVRPVISGDEVLFARQDGEGNWRSELYDTTTNQTNLYKTGDEEAFPKLEKSTE